MYPRTIGHLENIFTPAPASRAIFYLTIVKIQCCTIPIQYWVYTRNVLLRRLMLEIQSLTNPNYVGWGPDPIIMTQIVVINWEKNKQSLTKYFVFLPIRIQNLFLDFYNPWMNGELFSHLQIYSVLWATVDPTIITHLKILTIWNVILYVKFSPSVRMK